jgi:hypothetical protein
MRGNDEKETEKWIFALNCLQKKLGNRQSEENFPSQCENQRTSSINKSILYL